MKGYLIGLGIIILLGIGGLSWQTNSLGYFKRDNSMLDYIPPSYLGVVYIPDATLIKQHIKETEQWKDLQNIEFANKLTSLVETVESVFASIKEPGESVELFPFVASLHLTAPDAYDYLIHVKAIDISFWKLDQWITKLEKNGYEIEVHYFNGANIYEIKGGNLKEPLSFAQYGQTVTCSRYATLIEEAINEQTEGLHNIFGKSYSGNSDKITAYLNFENAPFLNTLFSKDSDSTIFDQAKRIAKGAYCEWEIKEKQFDVIGKIIFNTENKTVQQSDTLSKNTPAHYVPYNSPIFIQQTNKPIELVTTEQKTLLNKYYNSWYENEWAIFAPEFQVEALESCLLLKCNDTKRATNMLSLLSKKKSRKVERSTYRDFEIRSLQNSEIVNILLGEYWAKNYENSHFTSIENYILIGSNKRVTQLALDQYLNKNTLGDEPDFQTYYNKSVAKEGIYTYIQPRFLLNLLSKNPSEGFAQSLEKYKNSYTTFSPLQLHIEPSGNFEGVLAYNFQAGERSAMVWSVVLDAPPAGEPKVIQYNDKNEILMQDKKDELYLLTNEGQIRWRATIDAPILGKVNLIDFYKNGEKQILFNTENNIYVLDLENGESIGEFPLKLSDKATTGMLLANFGGERERIFIPCRNEKVYGYELSGRLLQGWNPKEGLGLIEQPLQYLKQDQNAYMIAANVAGTISFLDRGGNLEFVSPLESPLISPFQIDERESLKVVVATCANGKTYVINQEGVSWAKNYVPIDSTGLFLSDNVLASEAEEMVFAHNNKVAIFNISEKLSEYDLPCSPSDLFTTTLFDVESKRTGVFCAENNQIYLLDYDKIQDGFPMKASTPFVITDLFNNHENMLVAGGVDGNVFAYRLK